MFESESPGICTGSSDCHLPTCLFFHCLVSSPISTSADWKGINNFKINYYPGKLRVMCYVEVLFQVFLFSCGDNSLISKCNFNPYVPILSPLVNYSLTAIFDYCGEIIPSHWFLLEMPFWVPCLSVATLYLKLAADLGILCDILGGHLCFLYSLLLFF